MPKGTKVTASEPSGVSSWAKTAKVSVILQDGASARYFLKCATVPGSQALAEGEYHSATNVNSVVLGFGPQAIGWGKYDNQETATYFFLGTFHDMDFPKPPKPEEIIPLVSQLHGRGTSPNGMFGYPVPVVCGRMQRTVTWTNSWAESFTFQLKDVNKYDNDANGSWPEYDVACDQLIDAVIPRLLGLCNSMAETSRRRSYTAIYGRRMWAEIRRQERLLSLTQHICAQRDGVWHREFESIST